jgi:RNA polymerase sigma-70 factor (ECF subfamily)
MRIEKKEIINDDLIRRAQQGDISAFEQLVYFYEKRIFNFCIKYTNSKEDAEDLTQEIFWKVFNNINKYNFQYAFSTWLYTIVKNSIYDMLRKRKKTRHVKYIDDLEANSETTVDFQAYKKTEKEIHNKIDLSLALSKIRPEYEKVLKLFYWKGFDYKEIGRIMQIPLNTVKTYISRAKHSLLSYFEKNDEEVDNKKKR